MILNQPFNGHLGDLLIKNLKSGKYSRFIIFSAFAKNSGVSRLREAISEFKNNNGKVEAFIGLDANGTSYEAVRTLFELTDSLYIIHDTMPTVTYHSKIYFFSGSDTDNWIAIGSNNLTSGGLWTNIESAYVTDCVKDSDLTSIEDIVRQYKQTSFKLSYKINSEADINKLLKMNLLPSESSIQKAFTGLKRSGGNNNSTSDPDIFGTLGGMQLPPKDTPQSSGIKKKKENGSFDPTGLIGSKKNNKSFETMWFETRAMTGGSRNILDLSMKGNVIAGSGTQTRYKTNSPDVVLGSVSFFDIDPLNDKAEKNITILYHKKDYKNCTIKFAPDNGSWRIQFKGKNADGEKLSSIEGANWMTNKIIILRKIDTSTYVLRVVNKKRLNFLMRSSVFTAANGNSKISKKYGLFKA